MSRFNNSFNSSCAMGSHSLARHLCDFIGQTVTIFTTSGGASGCGFTGVILTVNCNFVRLVTQQGTPPSNPLSHSICDDWDEDEYEGGGGLGGIGGGLGGGIGGKVGNTVGGIGGGIGAGLGMIGGDNKHKHHNGFKVGSVCDIPIDRIAAFCHNAV